jgi:hypothetical protein
MFLNYEQWWHGSGWAIGWTARSTFVPNTPLHSESVYSKNERRRTFHDTFLPIGLTSSLVLPVWLGLWPLGILTSLTSQYFLVS